MRLIDADKLLDMLFRADLDYESMGGVNYCIDKIEGQPTIEIPQWIPCSERLPETDGTFLVTVKSRRKTRVDICNFSKYAKIESYRWGGQYVSMNVIAWKQLPESYKGE